jgi:hypothetical protein
MNTKVQEFQQSVASTFSETAILSVMAVLLVVLAIVLLFMFIRGLPDRQERQSRQDVRLEILLDELHLVDSDRELLEHIGTSVDPPRTVAMLESRKAFEEVVEEFRRNQAEDPALRRVPSLRQKLGYSFNNPRTPFDDTRMLLAGLRLQCRLPVAREVSFLTGVMGVTEQFFYIRPPRLRGTVVDLRKFPELAFRITREDDAEYRFTARVAGQNDQLAALEHTREVQRLLLRQAPRVAVKIATRFFVVPQAVVADRGHTQFKEAESQYALDGNIEDLSIGGALVAMNAGEQSPQEGDLILFRLREAQISDSIVSTVIGVLRRSESILQVHCQYVGLRELQRLKISRYLEEQTARAARVDTAQPTT